MYAVFFLLAVGSSRPDFVFEDFFNKNILLLIDRKKKMSKMNNHFIHAFAEASAKKEKIQKKN